MLNRRILRVKAMQALYAYFTAKESIKEVLRNDLREIHALDPAKHDFSDKALFEAKKKQAVKLFNQGVFSGEFDTTEDAAEDVKTNVEKALAEYQSLLKKEAKLRKSEMMQDARGLQKLYIKLLALPVELEQREKLDAEKEESSRVARQRKYYPLIGNAAIETLKNSELLNKEIASTGISWDLEQDQIKSWYRDHIRKTETLEEIFTGEDQKSPALLEVFKKAIFKNETILSYFEDNYLHWSENQPIIKSMVIKTIKNIVEGNPFEFAELTKNGEEDFEFLEILFNEVVDKNDYLDELIASHTKNWDVDRIAITDKVILKLSLVEIMNAPSIPVKVSINESIEIAKAYSTPKSKQFINGVLDVLSNELTSTGKIRKSGRGLIDNR